MTARKPLVITYTNLFPSGVRPGHGTFVQERMQRVMAGQDDLDWCVVSAVPAMPRPFATAEVRLLRRLPPSELVAGIEVHHPRYRHWPVVGLAGQARRLAAATLPLLRGLAAGRPVVLDAHYVYPDGVAALLVAAELGLPCLVTARGSDVNVVSRDRRVAPQVRRLLPRAASLLAVSQALCRQVAAVAGVDLARVHLARNGVDLAAFAPGDRAAARQRLDLPAHRRLLLGVGRLVADKGFALLVAALRDLPADVDVVLVGAGPAAARLRTAAPPGRLHLLGERPRPEVALAMQAADLLALPSFREGWPNVVTEALACGLPVVASRVGGVPEILTDPVAGETVPAGDRAALVGALRRQLDLPHNRHEVRAFAARYSWEAPIAVVRGLLRQALAGGR